jgi:hypothetical protein
MSALLWDAGVIGNQRAHCAMPFDGRQHARAAANTTSSDQPAFATK